MSSILKLLAFFTSKKIGQDCFGNCYYQAKRPNHLGRLRRWVVYQRDNEPSSVPPEWHVWLHYTTDIIPSGKFSWQRMHESNKTGTVDAYFPPGHVFGGNKRKKATGDYEAWEPK